MLAATIGEVESALLEGASMRLCFALSALLLFSATPLAGAPADEAGFESLFDGKSLDGWDGDPKTFRVEEGAIVGGNLSARVPRNEFLCHKGEFADFELRLKFKLVGKGANAGVQLRSRRIPNHHEMKGYQADLGDGWWGSLYDESRRNKVLKGADKKVIDQVLKRGEWNDYTIRCQGRRIELWINGQQTVDYTEPDESLEQTGLIGVQIHGGPPSEAWYKDIRVKKL
jgi:hypothetical protein